MILSGHFPVEGVLATERREEALVYYWKTWRDIAGKPTKPFFVDLVDLENKAANMTQNGNLHFI